MADEKSAAPQIVRDIHIAKLDDLIKQYKAGMTAKNGVIVSNDHFVDIQKGEILFMVGVMVTGAEG